MAAFGVLWNCGNTGYTFLLSEEDERCGSKEEALAAKPKGVVVILRTTFRKKITSVLSACYPHPKW